MRNKKENIILILSLAVILIVGLFSIFNWDTIVYLFTQMLTGVSIVKEYILSLGFIGVLVISLVIIICFFFPVISSIPVQIASAVSYGLFFGVLHVLISIFLASQIAFLFTRSLYALQSEKRRQKNRELEEKIQNSDRHITYFLAIAYIAPFVPFMLIHMIAASSGMKWWKYSLITLIGPIPDIVLTLWVGEKIITTSSPVISFVMLFIVIVCVVVSFTFKDKIVNRIFVSRKEADKNGESGS